MRADRVFAYGATLGFLGDLLAGDPRRGHPVAAFGRAAGALERRMWRDHRAAGAVYAVLCAGGATGGAALAARGVRALAGRAAGVPAGGGRAAGVGATRLRSRGLPTDVLRSQDALSVLLTAASTWSVLGGTSLAREARAIGAALEAGDLAAARARLPHLCGRDPAGLDAAEIARAVVESVAENTSDAVVGALVWGGLCGVPGLVGFRAVNTLDAMVGHRSARYLRFGWAAARLDDLAGWPGARLTAALAVVAGPSPATALRTWREDARRHPSPNAGPVEAAFAGALRLRLGGPLSYAGRPDPRPYMAAACPAPVPSDIARAVRLSRRVSALALALTVLSSALASVLSSALAAAAAARSEAEGPCAHRGAGRPGLRGAAAAGSGGHPAATDRGGPPARTAEAPGLPPRQREGRRHDPAATNRPAAVRPPDQRRTPRYGPGGSPATAGRAGTGGGGR